MDSAPATLNTLNEIATALSGDASLAVTLTNKINSSGNKVYDTAVAASLPVGSGAKIQANTLSITSNTTSINASGNAVRDLAIASEIKPMTLPLLPRCPLVAELRYKQTHRL